MNMKLMRALVAMTALAIASATPVPAFAQQGSTAGQQVNVNRLPVSLQRIQRAIQQSASSESHEGLRILYQVDVYGRAPALELFTQQDDLVNGPVPGSGPTHGDMLYQMTPQEFRAPAADFTTLFRWLANKANKK